MMYFDIFVKRAVNGYVVSFWEKEDGVDVESEFAFEESETEHGEIECFQRLLYYITDHFGFTGSKHDKRRIRITTDNDE
jgi:hypothetical protein